MIRLNWIDSLDLSLIIACLASEHLGWTRRALETLAPGLRQPLRWDYTILNPVKEEVGFSSGRVMDVALLESRLPVMTALLLTDVRCFVDNHCSSRSLLLRLAIGLRKISGSPSIRSCTFVV
ncbi:hypothetical protein MUK42_37197 [Musa troglodytarum]|uniref:Uncharacterized protein n=1 Tax=Musa troglodytarum TaxID=320322 RepID=A0A9E7J8U7_9LILI|nr:hypothetical protein MUK42_37197 [Musa troglodytarum]